VNTIRLEIGELSCVGADALRFCFDAVARGTVAERARLEIIRVPGEGVCGTCGRTAPMTALYDACPCCSDGTMQPQRGTEMRVKEIEVD
jgi:hydrogenase nickel incorporation protein HypA/HybF